MDPPEPLRQGAGHRGEDFTPLLVLGVILSEEGPTQTVLIRTVANEVLLRALLATPAGRRWLHDALDRLCDATRPPDDQPRDAVIRRLVVESTEPPRDGTGRPP